MEFYSATKKNDSLSFAGKWMELENIIFSEVNQVQKAKNHIYPLICGINTNTAILWKTGHTKGCHMQERWGRMRKSGKRV
jgi:hypothetical protein